MWQVVKLWSKNLSQFAGLMFAAETIQQKVTKEPGEPVDWGQVGRVTAAGVGGIGVVCCAWYFHIFDRVVKPGFTLQRLTLRVVVDGTIAGGSSVAAFYACLALVERKPVVRMIRENFAHSYFASIVYWSPIQYANFYFFKKHQRVIFIAWMTLIWNTILCFLKKTELHDVIEKDNSKT